MLRSVSFVVSCTPLTDLSDHRKCQTISSLWADTLFLAHVSVLPLLTGRISRVLDAASCFMVSHLEFVFFLHTFIPAFISGDVSGNFSWMLTAFLAGACRDVVLCDVPWARSLQMTGKHTFTLTCTCIYMHPAVQSAACVLIHIIPSGHVVIGGPAVLAV